MLPMVVAHQKAQESARKPLVAPIWPRLPGLTARPGTSVGTRSRSAASSGYLRRSGSCVCGEFGRIGSAACPLGRCRRAVRGRWRIAWALVRPSPCASDVTTWRDRTSATRQRPRLVEVGGVAGWTISGGISGRPNPRRMGAAVGRPHGLLPRE